MANYVSLSLKIGLIRFVVYLNERYSLVKVEERFFLEIRRLRMKDSLTIYNHSVITLKDR